MGWIYEQASLMDPMPIQGKKYYMFSEPVETVIERLENKGRENWNQLDEKEYGFCMERIKEMENKLMTKLESIKEHIYEKAVNKITGELRVDVCVYKGSYNSLPEYATDIIKFNGSEWDYYIGDYINDWIYDQVEELNSIGTNEKDILDLVMSKLEGKVNEYLEAHKKMILKRINNEKEEY